jgi:CubicO group peptidase (beta-lactamase class C family)
MNRRQAILLLAAMALLAAGGLTDQATGEPPPPRPELAPQPDLEKRVDRLFARWDRDDSPGCAVAVLHHGRIVYQRGYGMADLEHEVRITPATVFHAGSMAKQFTALCILLLVEEKRLALDDDVRKYIPELPDVGEPIRLRHMLHHTSGLREHHNLLQFAGWRWRDLITERDILTMMGRQRGLNFRPGEEFLYSNSNYALLAVVIKRVSGQSLREFAEERVFKPLGMTHTQVVEDHSAAVKGRAAGHVRRDDGGYDVERPPYDFTGSTNLLTTVEDLAKWDANFFDAKVGGKEVVTKRVTAGRLKGGEAVGYAGGLFLGNYRKLPIVSHAGADVGFRAEMLRFPEQHFSVVVLCNLFDVSATRLAQQVADLYLADEFPPEVAPKGAPPPGAPAPPDLQNLTGL